MQSVVREAMEEGAWGLSIGLDYPPGSYADTDELVALSGTSASLGGHYQTHTRAGLRAQGLLAPGEEAVEIGRRSGIPVHLTHYRQSASGVGSHLDYLGLVEDSRAQDGRDLRLLHLPLLRHHRDHRDCPTGQRTAGRSA